MKFKTIIIFMIIGLSLLLLNCEKSHLEIEDNTEVENNKFDSEYFSHNIAIVKVSLRSVDEFSYVKEVEIVDFSKSAEAPLMYGLGSDVYVDNGEYDDQYAEDGIFTSMNSYQHSDELPYDEENKKMIIDSKPFINQSFRHHVELFDYIQNDASGMSRLKEVGIHDCKISWKDCDEIEPWWKKCAACVFDTGCIWLSDCKFSLSFF